MITEQELFAVLEAGGVPVTDAIRADVERDKADPRKWTPMPGMALRSFRAMFEPAPDQSRAQAEAAERTEYHKTHPVGRIFDPKTGEVTYRYASDENPIRQIELRPKPGVTADQIADAAKPHLVAEREYAEAFLLRYVETDKIMDALRAVYGADAFD